MELTAPSTARPMLLTPRDRLIVALDFPSKSHALALVDSLEGRCLWFKVGLQLFLAAGPSLVDTLRNRGFNVFVDLKLHDIPNTVAGAVRSLSATGAQLLTVHAAGGEPMMRAAAEAAALSSNPPQLLAVTVLTSMDGSQLLQTGITASPAEQVLRLARLAHSAGIPDLVCSPHECAGLRTEFGPEPLLVVPGIRAKNDLVADQNRISTPSFALSNGASMLVVGRPITHATDPVAAVESLFEQIST